MPTTTFKDRHGHPGSVGYVAMHLLFLAAGVYGLVVDPSPAVADLLPGRAAWALALFSAMWALAALAALLARLAGMPRLELWMINVYGGLLALWAFAVTATDPPAIMLAIALLAVTAGTFGTTKASTYRLENGIDRVERLWTRWQRDGNGRDRSQGETRDAERTDDG